MSRDEGGGAFLVGDVDSFWWSFALDPTVHWGLDAEGFADAAVKVREGGYGAVVGVLGGLGGGCWVFLALRCCGVEFGLKFALEGRVTGEMVDNNAHCDRAGVSAHCQMCKIN